MNLLELKEKYLESQDFKLLANKTQKDYVYFLNIMLFTSVNGRQILKSRVSNFTGVKARRAYEYWLKRGISFANHICSVSKKMYSYANEMGYAETNPFKTFKCKTTHNRKVTWTREQVKTFLDHCYLSFEYRNLGLIVQMAYEWCQRVGDMRMLKFDNINFDTGVLNLEQSKRRALVHLPVSDNLLDMLRQQKEEFGFQDWVAPYPFARGKSYEPYTLHRLSKVARRVLNQCGLPKELRIADLRRTGTTEMVEAGVSMAQIMSVTGHSTPNSVKPYMKNTYASAENALTKREIYVKSTKDVPQ